MASPSGGSGCFRCPLTWSLASGCSVFLRGQGLCNGPDLTRKEVHAPGCLQVATLRTVLQNQIPWGMVTFKVSWVRLQRFRLSEGFEVIKWTKTDKVTESMLEGNQRRPGKENHFVLCVHVDSLGFIPENTMWVGEKKGQCSYCGRWWKQDISITEGAQCLLLVGCRCLWLL